MKKSNHYIDNKEFFDAMCKWKTQIQEAEDQGEIRPPVSEYIGICFMKIAEHLAQKPNFANYPYKDEMIHDSIENCLMYAHNFDPNKSKNPFSYFTQIIYYAFVRRIDKEKKQTYIKFKMTENVVNTKDFVHINDNDVDFQYENTDYHKHYDIIASFEKKLKEKRKKNKVVSNLEKFME